MNYKEIKKSLAEVDWKSSSEDILYAVRAAYKKSYPFLMEKNFDELSENYAAEETLDFINALGQEISAQGHLLYEIDADSDSYLLTIIPAEAEEELKSILKEQRKRGALRKQARRKAGSEALCDLGRGVTLKMQNAISEHLKETEVLLKKVPFWKYATIATVCIEQEYAVYETLAKGCAYDMSKFLGKVIKRYWQAIPTGYSIDDSFLLAIEESIFSPRDEWEELALQIVKDMEHNFYALWQKDTKAAFANMEKQFEVVCQYARLAGLSEKETDLLVEKTCRNQQELIEELVNVPNKEKKAFIAQLQDRDKVQLIELAHLAEICPKCKEKPAKKKLPEIRHTSVDFDMAEKNSTDEWLLHSTPEQWVTKVWEEVGKGAFYTNYVEKKLPELCRVMSGRYFEYAQRDYIKNRMPERVRGFWYLYAYSELCMFELVEKGYELKENSGVKHDMDWFADSMISGAMMYAYAAGAEDLIPRLVRFARGVHKERPYTGVQDHMELFAGKNSEELYRRVEQWEKSDYREMILWILKGDTKEFRKALLHSVRHKRKEYDMSLSFFGPWTYACVKLAKKYGMEIEPVKVVELLDWNFDETPIERGAWKLPLQEDIDKWLKDC